MIKERINLLKNLLIKFSIDGYIIPSNDKYMSEYVPKYAKRLEYVTGFTGSNGMAIICNNTILFFTDGRYLEQANKELDSQLFQIFDLKDINLFSWQNYIAQDAVIGYDPELFTYPLISKLFNNLKSKLQKITGNLVDQIWHGQPPEPISKVYLHDIKFAGSSHIEKINKCRMILLSYCTNATDHEYSLIITDTPSICWLLNLRGDDVAYTPLIFAKVILTSKQIYLFIAPSRINSEIITALPEIKILPEEEFEHILKSSENIFIDDSNLSIHITDLITDKKVQKITNPCILPKACKNDIEVKHAIDFHIKDGVALCEFFADLNNSLSLQNDVCVATLLYDSKNRQKLRHCKEVKQVTDVTISQSKLKKIATATSWLRNDDENASRTTTTLMPSNDELTEYSLGVKLTKYRAKQEGYVSDSFPTICGFKENSAIIHYRATLKTAKKIEGNGILLIDSGAQYQGATTDITRTITIGSANAEQKKRYTQVLKGHIALSRIKFPKGICGSNLEVLARQYLWQEAQDYPHSTGHGVGSFLSVHEGPQGINFHNKVILQPGMILSNEPGFYIPNEYGIRIENLMYVKENSNNWLSFEPLSLMPYDHNLINYNMLNNDEIEYIKQYYEKIKSMLYLFLSKNAQIWLDKQINLFLNTKT